MSKRIIGITGDLELSYKLDKTILMDYKIIDDEKEYIS